MRLALLIGCKPSLDKESSFVFIREGTWRVRYENVKDSLFRLIARAPMIDTIMPILDGHEIIGGVDIKVAFNKAGSEHSINVWAEQV